MILQKWKPFFAWLPVETLIYEQQEDYYEALNASNTKGDSTIFVTFMLQIIRDALAEIIETQDSHHNVGVNVGTNEEKVLMLLRQDGRLTAKDLASTLGLTERQIERIMASLKQQGRLVRRGASKNGYWEVIDEP